MRACEGLGEGEFRLAEAKPFGVRVLTDHKRTLEDGVSLVGLPKRDEGLAYTGEGVCHGWIAGAEFALPDVESLPVGHEGFGWATESSQDLSAIAELVGDARMHCALRPPAYSEAPITYFQRLTRPTQRIQCKRDISKCDRDVGIVAPQDLLFNGARATLILESVRVSTLKLINDADVVEKPRIDERVAATCSLDGALCKLSPSVRLSEPPLKTNNPHEPR